MLFRRHEHNLIALYNKTQIFSFHKPIEQKIETKKTAPIGAACGRLHIIR
jgi:hypothetical protein